MLVINSNGSKWAGQSLDTIDDLLEVLSTHPLDRRFEGYGNFIVENPCEGVENTSDEGPRYVDGDPLFPENPGVVNFFGNFFTVSHVFNIDTDEPDIIELISLAIAENKQRSDYLDQENPCQPAPVASVEISAQMAFNL